MQKHAKAHFLNVLPLPRRLPSAVFCFQGPAGLKGGEGPQGPPGPIVSNLSDIVLVGVTCSVVEMTTAGNISERDLSDLKPLCHDFMCNSSHRIRIKF